LAVVITVPVRMRVQIADAPGHREPLARLAAAGPHHLADMLPLIERAAWRR
jgi:hypothetical protein